MKHKILVALTLTYSAAYAAIDIKPKLPDIEQFVGAITKTVGIAADLQKLGPQFKAFPSKINTITVCMNFKAKRFPDWAAFKFNADDLSRMSAKKLTKDQMQKTAQQCLKVGCISSRQCTVSLVNEMISMITNIQNTVISDSGLMGIVFFNLFNTFAEGKAIDDVQTEAKKVFDMFQENKEILESIRDGIEKSGKKS